ncbi:MAG TPA: LuxR C-terminal-related transcriptional regulator, partial [Longimicrobiales bacterium]|nr:LuxR C-terminal-related transcriptional regulator [Longimicrobiales bacterium]
PPISEFADLLYGWTRGNPYFIEQTLDALVESGRLYQRDGTWLGWEARELELPTSIRDAVLTRIRGLPEDAVSVAELMAVVGGRTRLPLLEKITSLGTHALTNAVEDLIRMGLVEERAEDGVVLLDFRHPLTRETLYQRLSLTRSRMFHRTVAEGLERLYGSDAEAHADELAYHFAMAGGSGEEPRAVRYLAAAGRSALRRHADREAAAYLDAAVSRLRSPSSEAPEAAAPEPEPPDLTDLEAELARARARLGQYQEAREIWTQLLERARTHGSRRETARAHRHLGLLAYWMGRHGAALDHYGAALDALGRDDPVTEARLQLATGVALQELGRSDEARTRVESALVIAEELDDPALKGRAHRALALLNTWVGETGPAREHGGRAVELAQKAGDEHVEFWGRWAIACLAGLTGGPEGMESLIDETRAVADRIRSPVLRLWVSELALELAYFSGDWDGALALGERGISLASDLNQRTLLVRLLVWTATVYFGRGDTDRGGELVDRAWDLADPDRERSDRPTDIHAVVPAYIGRTALLLARGAYREAIEVGERGLEIADRSGYVVWILPHLLPLVGEAYIRLLDLEGAARIGDRLRREGQRMQHKLGLVWADTCDALIAWHSGDVERAAKLLRASAEALEARSIIPEAARIRRQLAGRLADLGDREGALVELRKVHDVFGRLGAQPELEKTREQFREVGSRPPSRAEAEGTAELTPREAEIASQVADRKSNKAIARELGISPRTVTTHLSNIYRKLEIGSRGELVDLVREARLPVEPRQAPPP